MQKNFAQTDYAATARQAAAEGAVLLRYHRHALPLEMAQADDEFRPLDLG